MIVHAGQAEGRRGFKVAAGLPSGRNALPSRLSWASNLPGPQLGGHVFTVASSVWSMVVKARRSGAAAMIAPTFKSRFGPAVQAVADARHEGIVDGGMTERALDSDGFERFAVQQRPFLFDIAIGRAERLAALLQRPVRSRHFKPQADRLAGRIRAEARRQAARGRRLRNVACGGDRARSRALRARHRLVPARLRPGGTADLAAGDAGGGVGRPHPSGRQVRRCGLWRRHDPVAPPERWPGGPRAVRQCRDARMGVVDPAGLL